MISKFTELTVLVFCSIYLFAKFLDIKITKRTVAFAVPFSMVVAALAELFSDYLMPFIYFFMIFVIGIFNQVMFRESLNTTVIFSTIAFALSFSLLFICAVLCSPFIFIIYSAFGQSDVTDFVLFLIIEAVDILVCCLLFKIKKFKHGMTFLKEKISNEIGLIISFLILFAISITNMNTSGNIMVTVILMITTLLCGMAFLVWWRKEIKHAYNKKVSDRLTESLQQNIQELKKETDKLRYHNDELSKIIHSDNKLIPAMVMAVKSLLTGMEEDAPEIKKAEIKDLLNNLDKMYSERRGMITSYESNNTSQLHPTGFITVDATLLYMKHRARDLSTEFDYTISFDVSEIIGKTIDEAGFNTILADLIENALIAVSFSESGPKAVRVIFKKTDNSYIIEIYDSGIPFQAKTILNLGKKRATTHSETGGSGIGLMTIYEILKKANASLEINENIQSEPFTKCISVSFDTLSEFRVESTRNDIIKACKQRGDILLNC